MPSLATPLFIDHQGFRAIAEQGLHTRTCCCADEILVGEAASFGQPQYPDPTRVIWAVSADCCELVGKPG
jgi:hypothetical protein